MTHSDRTADAELADAVLTAELLRRLHALGDVSAARLGRVRALFHRPACGDAPFGLVCRGEVFFKTGPETVTKYIARSMCPFRTASPGQPLRGFRRVPPEVLEDANLLETWATWAVDAARRFGGRRPRKLKRRRGRGVPPLQAGCCHTRDDDASGDAEG